ncbi:MAG TPA: CYTH domain-containing protein [Candidatus Dormibacteraeota bacterium]|nr:CYTH domain-containing protein [Candidatus Dormibacteraeota bacterium]
MFAIIALVLASEDLTVSRSLILFSSDGLVVSRKEGGSRLFETEVAYMITVDDEKVLQDIARITSLTNYRLKPRDTLTIRDMYFDTRQEILRQKKINLRLRKTDHDLLLSIKSDPKRLPGKGVRRREVELSWSISSLLTIADELEMKVPISMMREFSRLSPAKVLAEMGFREIQDRVTNREVRDIVRRDKPRSSPIAEMDIDRVTFLARPRVRICELEIEAKARGSINVIREIGETIASIYPGFIREWVYGKFATGIAIQLLSKSGRLKRYIERKQLKPNAFSLVERTIVSQRL